MEEKKEKEMKVRIENFIVERDEDGIISVASVSKNWFVGISAGSMTHLMLNNTLFVENPSEEDKDVAYSVITAMYASCMMAYNADFANDVFESIERIGKESEVGNEENDEKALNELRQLDEMKEESENIEKESSEESISSEDKA